MNKSLVAGIVVGGVAVAGAATGLGVGLANNTAEYQVSIVSELESAEFDGAGKYKVGQEVELSAQDVEGYRFVYWSLPNGEISRENPYTFTLTNANYGTYTAVYEKEYTITVGEYQNGTVISDRPVAIVGEWVELIVTPDENYYLSSLSYTTSTGITTIEYSNGYKFLMPAEDVEITATFAQSAFNITKASMTNGDITLSNTSGVNGTEITVSAQPETGYELDQLYYIAQGSTTHVAITANTFTLTSNVTVYATFKLIDYDFSFTNESETEVTIKRNGQIFTGSTVNYGDIITIEYTPSATAEVIIEVEGAELNDNNEYVVTGNLTISYIENEYPDANEFTTLSFTYDEDEKTASVAMNSSNLPTGELVIPGRVKHDGEVYTITSIADNGFYWCNNITSLVIPETVTYIGRYAFNHCQKIESITIPENVTSVGNWAFESCEGITEITIPSNFKQIGLGTFASCLNLKTVIISDGVEIIGESAFANCKKIKSITIPESVTIIGNGAFYYCRDIAIVTIGSGVTSIGERAFYECNHLTTVTFEEGNQLTSIGGEAFGGCYKLVEIYNLSSLQLTAGSDDNGGVAYYAKSIHTSKNEESNLETIDGVIYYKNSETDYIAMGLEDNTKTNIVFDSRTTSISQYAFFYCDSLVTVTIPPSVTSIGQDAFGSCENLTTLIFEEGSQLTSIGNWAFECCFNLTTVIIDSSYAYRTATSSSDFGNLLQNATTVKVLKSIVDDENNTNDWLNSDDWTKAEETETVDGQEYYVYTKN